MRPRIRPDRPQPSTRLLHRRRAPIRLFRPRRPRRARLCDPATAPIWRRSIRTVVYGTILAVCELGGRRRSPAPTRCEPARGNRWSSDAGNWRSPRGWRQQRHQSNASVAPYRAVLRQRRRRVRIPACRGLLASPRRPTRHRWISCGRSPAATTPVRGDGWPCSPTRNKQAAPAFVPWWMCVPSPESPALAWCRTDSAPRPRAARWCSCAGRNETKHTRPALRQRSSAP